jgi:pimeloyl-ACP methyl ester carboxylesterase
MTLKRLWILPLLLLLLAACAPQVKLAALPSDTSKPRLPGMTRALTWNYQGNLIYYETGGKGTPVLLLHGLVPGMDSFNTYRKNTEALLEADYRVYALDLFGYGRSGRAARRLTDGYYLGLITTFLDEVVARPAVVMAMGRSGAYAIDIAANRPSLISALVLNAPSGYGAFPPRKGAAQVFNHLASGRGQNVYVERSSLSSITNVLQNELYFDSKDISPEVVSSFYHNLQVEDSAWTVYSEASGSMNHGVKPFWPKVSQPTLLLWGQDNTLIPLADAESFLSERPRTEFKLLDNARFSVQEERGLAFNAFVVEFLLRNVPPG